MNQNVTRKPQTQNETPINNQQPQSKQSSDPHEFFDKYNNEKKKQNDYASLPDYLVKYIEIENKITSGLLSKSEMQGILQLLIELTQSAMATED